MPVLMIATVSGDPDDLVPRYEKQQGLIAEEFGGTPPGYMAHACARSDEGLVITNVVESEETIWETRPRFQKTAEEVGLPEPDIAVYPIVNVMAKEIAPAVR